MFDLYKIRFYICELFGGHKWDITMSNHYVFCKHCGVMKQTVKKSLTKK